MDVMNLFKMVADLFIRFWSIQMTIGKYKITVAAVIIFSLAVCLVIKFMKGISD